MYTFDLFLRPNTGDSKLTGRNSLRSAVGLEPALRGVHTTGGGSSLFDSFGGDGRFSGEARCGTAGFDSAPLPGDHTPIQHDTLDINYTQDIYTNINKSHTQR